MNCVRLGVAAAVAVLAAACLEPATSECGGVICPVGKVCAAAHGRCVLSSQIDVCDGVADGSECAFANVNDGLCDTGVCFGRDCGNGHIDPGEMCDDGNTEDLDGCSADCTSDETCGNGVVDPLRGEQCDDGNDIDGDTCQTSCLVPVCGDEIVDIGEVCDDGNFVDGDGCNSVCTSDEICGNGWTDFGIGEQCDDGAAGALVNHDGCTSECTAELPLWLERTFETGPGPRRAVAVYDARRDVVVATFGVGPLGEPRGPHHERIGGDWYSSALLGPGDPPSRFGHAAVYDAARGRTVVFGGEQATPIPIGGMASRGDIFGDLWEYDGVRWVEVDAAGGPSPRSLVAAAYDAARRRMVVFGGDTGDSLLSETWEYDGTAWIERAIAGPPARARHVMAYDAARGRVVLFGGVDDTGAPLSDTWEYDGNAWVETTPTQVPTARGAMAYDADRRVMVLFGGNSNDTLTAATWEYDGASWVEAAALGPAPRVDHAMAYDANRRAMVIAFGGVQTSGPVFEDTWRYDGAFAELPRVVSPGRRIDAASAYDLVRGRLLLFGGGAPNPPNPFQHFGDLWSYERGQWREIDDRNAPPIPDYSAMVYDRARDVAVLVVAPLGGDRLETYELSGRTWRRVVTTDAPSRRTRWALAYDVARQRTVLFGGGAGMGEFFDETWEYDGAAWTNVSPETSPSPRHFAMLAYDEARERTVLFGGSTGPMQLGDTWEYDGTTWTQLATEEAPSPRGTQSMDYYAPRRRIILFGGDPFALNDTWELDPVMPEPTWTKLNSPQSPEPRRAPIVRYDVQRHSLVAFGGDPSFDHWELSYSSAVLDERCTGGMDEDQDGAIDCADPDCAGMPCDIVGAFACIDGACACRGGPTETSCFDERDDDCDGLVDCDDPDCAATATCMAESSCADGADDDGDGFADCADAGCDGVGACEAIEVTCDDGVDNDGDGAVDCADLDCFLNGCEVLE